MPTTRTDHARRRRHAIPLTVFAPVLMLLALMGACTTPTPTPSPSPSESANPAPTATPAPTPEPTPLYSNTADPALAALIPPTVAGHAVQIPPITQFAYTPGDIGEVYGEIGLRFRTLQVAFVSRPRLSLYAMRLNAPFPTTGDLEPYLAEAARYVGIAGLHREPWTLQTIGSHVVWMRPGDNATLKGTQVYTWAAGEFVFLMIGTDEAQNHAMLAALPGEPPPTPTPAPSISHSPSVVPSLSAS
ncbi:MAG: hypothetical protein ABI978_00600 [Chloroflexota bacterium]